MTLLNRVYFPGGSDGKELTCDAAYLGSIPGFGRFPGGVHGNLLQYSCLENPHGQRSLVAGYSLWGHKGSDMAERLSILNRVNQVCLEQKKWKGRPRCIAFARFRNLKHGMFEKL